MALMGIRTVRGVRVEDGGIRLTDTYLAVHHRSPERDRLDQLVHRLTDEEVEDAIVLLEWLTDPERQYLVEQMIALSRNTNLKNCVDR